MRINIFKKLNKPSILQVTRSDGSTTWAPLNGFPAVHHDLMHYVIERELVFKQGFYGILNQGYDIKDFELPRAQRPEALLPKNLPLEAKQGEFITGVLQTAHWQQQSPKDTVSALQVIFQEKQLPYPPDLDEQKINLILQNFDILWQEWISPTDGITLDVDWL